MKRTPAPSRVAVSTRARNSGCVAQNSWPLSSNGLSSDFAVLPRAHFADAQKDLRSGRRAEAGRLKLSAAQAQENDHPATKLPRLT